MAHFDSGVSLILGGARSGKSAFAESLVEDSGRSKIYIATSEIWDDEMQSRVDLHKQRRGDDWVVVEEPLDLKAAIAKHAGSSTCILVDCLTLWLTNLMMAERSIEEECAELTSSLTRLGGDCSVLLVSNEVGQGIVPADKMARQFRDYAGRLHQNLAAAVPHVWFVTAGLPQKLK